MSKHDLFSVRYNSFRFSKPDSVDPPNSYSFSDKMSFSKIEKSFDKTSQKTISFRDLPFLCLESDPEIALSLKIKILDILEIPKKSENYSPSRLKKLPGPQPITLTRNRLAFFKTEKFWLAEKSDGERCLMLILKDATFLVDRSFSFYRFDTRFYSEALCVNGESLLDGEIILDKDSIVELRNESKKRYKSSYEMYSFLRNKPRFLCFDVVMYNGEKVMNKKLSDRFQYMSMLTVQYRKKIKTSHPLAMLSKTFFRTKDLDKLLSEITFSEKEKNYVCFDRKRGVANLNDGIIFTPDDDSYLQKRKLLFKWKWYEMNTFDLRIERPFFCNKNFMDVYCSGNDSTLIFLKKLGPFTDQDRNSLSNFLEKSEVKESCVIECGYALNAIGLGEWTVHKVRVDRNIPNHVSTILRTMEVMAENVNLSEIRHALIKCT